MTNEQQPEALRLAKILEGHYFYSDTNEAAAELRRLCSQNQELLVALQALTHSLDYEDLLHDDQRKAFKHARDAIAKAGGAA